jgi:hypothetical protein
MTNKQFLLDSFYNELSHTTWLLKKDSIYSDAYFELLSDIEHYNNASDDELELLIDRLGGLETLYDERVKDSSVWIQPKTRAANELIHDENGKLTQESIELLQTAIVNKNGEKTLISDTGKTISFEEKWYQMINSCSFKAIAVDRLTDFISKFIEADGWAKYFVGNIGKNLKRQIQEYHVMDKYNLNHGTSYAAMHLGGDTTKCVLVSVDTNTSDGKGEPSSMTFLEIGAHTIIDRFIVGSFKVTSGKSITEAGPDDLAELFEVN